MPPKNTNQPPAYVRTKLPVLLDLQNRNTRDQIESGSSRATTWSGGNSGSVVRESRDECGKIMQDSCKEFLTQKGLWNSILSREDDIRYFWEWLREFHSEYTDDWYARNMPRLKQEFHPIWVRAMKESSVGGGGGCGSPSKSPDNAANANHGVQDSNCDLLDNIVSTSNADKQPQPDLLDSINSGGINSNNCSDDLLNLNIPASPSKPIDTSGTVDDMASFFGTVNFKPNSADLNSSIDQSPMPQGSEAPPNTVVFNTPMKPDDTTTANHNIMDHDLLRNLDLLNINNNNSCGPNLNCSGDITSEIENKNNHVNNSDPFAGLF